MPKYIAYSRLATTFSLYALVTYIFTRHGEKRATLVARNRVIFAYLYNQIVQTTGRANLWYQECLDGEEANDNCDDKGMKVICQERCLDSAYECVQYNTHREQECGRNDMNAGSDLG